MKIEDDVALKMHKHATCIVAERFSVGDSAGDAKWSGPIFNIADSVGGDLETTSFTALGWMEELNHRIVQAADESGAIFASVVGGQIAFSLIELARNRLDSSGKRVPMHIYPGVSHDTQVRSRTYKRQANFGQSINELIDIENGMDVVLDPIKRTFNTYPPVGASQLWVDRTDVHFAYGMKPNNVSSMQRVEDGAQTANSLTITGAGGLEVHIDDPVAITEQKIMLEEVLALADVSDTGILSAYGAAELLYRARGAFTLTMKPKSLTEEGLVYRPFDHFNLGDQVYVSCDRGRLQLRRHPMRIFQITINVDDEGNEIVSELQGTVSG